MKKNTYHKEKELKMAKIKIKSSLFTPKKTSIGRGCNRKRGNKGGGVGGSTRSKGYTKSYRGQG